MAYTSHMQNDTQHLPSLPFNAKLCLFGDDLGCDWEERCYQEKPMTTAISSSSKTKMIGQPIITRQIQTLASLESNYETSEDEEHMEEEVGVIDQVGEELVDEEEMEDYLDAEDDNDDEEDEDEYVEFCNLLTKSPACDAAASRLIHASFIASSFSFSMTNDDDSSEDGDEDNASDHGEATSENDSDEDEFGWSVPRTTCFGFDPFAVSGLFMPSLLSTIASYPSPSLLGETSCNSSNDYDNKDDECKELAQKLKDVNKRWLETYSNSNDDDSTLVDTENCVASQANGVTCKKNVHFCDKMMFIDILNKEEWADDYEGARKGPWEQYHRDHVRFENRIESMHELLSKVLVAEHRATVFQRLHETADLVTDDQNTLLDLLQALPASS